MDSDSDVEEYSDYESDYASDSEDFYFNLEKRTLSIYLKFLIYLISINCEIYDVTVIGDTVYSDIASISLLKFGIKYKLCRTKNRDRTILYKNKYNIYGDKSKKYNKLSSISVISNNIIQIKKLENHTGFEKLKDRQDELLDVLHQRKMDLSYLNLLDKDPQNPDITTITIIKKVINLSKNMSLVISTDNQVWFSKKIIIDNVQEDVEFKNINVISYDKGNVYNTSLETSSITSDLFSLKIPRTFMTDNWYNINPMHFPSTEDPFFTIMLLIFTMFKKN